MRGFRQNGAVDITIGMGETGPGMVSITSAPTIVKGVVITGHQVLDGQRANAPSGVVQGFDAITGALRWAWDMEHTERTGLPPEGETYARGTPNMWTTASGDEALGLVYLPLGNAAADVEFAPLPSRTNTPPRSSLSMSRPAARSGASKRSTWASGTMIWARSRP